MWTWPADWKLHGNVWSNGALLITEGDTTWLSLPHLRLLRLRVRHLHRHLRLPLRRRLVRRIRIEPFDIHRLSGCPVCGVGWLVCGVLLIFLYFVDQKR